MLHHQIKNSSGPSTSVLLELKPKVRLPAVARQKITLVRRDIAKQPVRRVPDGDLHGLLVRLTELPHDAFAAFPDAAESSHMIGDDGIIDRHVSNSIPMSPILNLR
jgi:hypothetical protein